MSLHTREFFHIPYTTRHPSVSVSLMQMHKHINIRRCFDGRRKKREEKRKTNKINVPVFSTFTVEYNEKIYNKI